ncbi:TlpA family protein disulfide reductase [Horticoccus sp. 23ND18S-11]|uniref:TlpA family protein disulfide reductase n=1 Tax=Horticoccus sp. 23ND18S-11 TaxID=3391832 RepID=UPI0039C99F0B
MSSRPSLRSRLITLRPGPFVAGLVWSLLALGSIARAELKTGDPFPALASAQLSGGAVPDSQGKILVVDFWASWCAPCKASFPVLGKVATDYAARKVVLVGVSVDESPAAYTAFMKKFAPPFPALHDASQSLVRAVQVPTMPTTYIIDRQGRVRAIHTGYHGEASDKRLRAELDALLAEKS